MSKEKVKQYVFLTIMMSVINFCVAGVLVGTTVINLKGAEAAEENIQQLNQQIAVIDQETEKQTEKQTEITLISKATSIFIPYRLSANYSVSLPSTAYTKRPARNLDTLNNSRTIFYKTCTNG